MVVFRPILLQFDGVIHQTRVAESITLDFQQLWGERPLFSTYVFERIHLALIFTVNVLFPGLVSVPTKTGGTRVQSSLFVSPSR
jgi:hypothetical protein